MEWAFDAISLQWIRKQFVSELSSIYGYEVSAVGINFLVAIKNKLFDFTHSDGEPSHTVWQGQSTEIEWNSEMLIVCQMLENCRIVSRFGCARSPCPNREIRFLRFQAKSLCAACSARPRSRNGYVRAEPFDFDRNHTYQPASMRIKCETNNQKYFCRKKKSRTKRFAILKTDRIWIWASEFLGQKLKRFS